VGPFLVPLLDFSLGARLRLRAAFAPFDAEVLRYLAVAAPLMLGVTLLTVDEWYDRWFGALIGADVVARLGYARQLMLLPVAVVGQAIGTAALPTLSRLWAQGRREELDALVLATLRAGLALGLLGAAAAAAFAEPIVRVVYERGRFAAEDTAAVASLLRIFVWAVPAWILQQIAVRPFYARGDTWRPMLLGTGVAVLAVPLYLVLGERHGGPGLAAAGAIGMSANALATILLARRLHGAPALGALLASALRAGAIAAAAGLAAGRLAPDPGEGLAAALLHLGLGGAIFAAVALALIPLLGDESLRSFSKRAAARLRRRSG
jgi:putative peptidoglycan lipid II flippase